MFLVLLIPMLILMLMLISILMIRITILIHSATSSSSTSSTITTVTIVATMILLERNDDTTMWWKLGRCVVVVSSGACCGVLVVNVVPVHVRLYRNDSSSCTSTSITTWSHIIIIIMLMILVVVAWWVACDSEHHQHTLLFSICGLLLGCWFLTFYGVNTSTSMTERMMSSVCHASLVWNMNAWYRTSIGTVCWQMGHFVPVCCVCCEEHMMNPTTLASCTYMKPTTIVSNHGVVCFSPQPALTLSLTHWRAIVGYIWHDIDGSE